MTLVFDPTTEGMGPSVVLQLKNKGINDLSIVMLECTPATGWIMCTADAYYNLVIDMTL